MIRRWNLNFVVYLDVFFCVNFGMNLVILILLKCLSKQKSSMLRIILASAFGGAGACITVICPGMNLMIKFLLLYVAVSIGMIVIAFSYNGCLLLIQNVVKLYVVSFFIGGLFHFLYYNMNDFMKERFSNKVYENASIGFLIVVGILLLLSIPVLMRLYHKMRRQIAVIYEVELWDEDNCVKGLGLYDTGNSLKDPITGKPVIIAEYNAIKSLLSIEMQEYIKNYFLVNTQDASMTKIKWIPYHSLGKNHGFLPGLFFSKMRVEIDGVMQEAEHVLVGLYQGSLSVGNEYQFILHEEYLSTNYLIRRKL